MEFDQSYNGAPVDWNFPSPGATPTNGSFGSGNVYHTPKTAAYPTHFQDAFTTPQMPSYATPQQPNFYSTTPVQRSQTSSETLRSNYYANMQAGVTQSAGHMMHPGHGHNMVSPTYGDTNVASMQLAMNTSFDSTQMRTPPPTRGTSAKRAQDARQIAFGTPSTIASRRFLTPQQAHVPISNGSFAHQTPLQIPQLQFSPDMYQFANVGPASAPVMAQTRVFWDQYGSPIHTVPQPTLDDPFAPNISNSMHESGASSQQHNMQPMSFDTPAMQSFAVQAQQLRPTSSVHMSGGMSASPNQETSGVNPSLVYTSPIRPPTRSNPQPERMWLPPPQPTGGSVSREHGRTDTVSSTDSATSRDTSNLHRSHTTGSVRPKSMYLPMNVKDSLSRLIGSDLIPRTASPAKRFGRPSLGSISEGRPRQRTSVILTVDENGRARTETRPVDDSPSRAIRERYPALFDSDSSDAESDASEQTPSRPASFIFDKRDERRIKAARLDPPVENLEGLHILRSSSSSSMKKGIPPSRAAVTAAAQLRRQGSFRRSTPSRNSQRRSLTSSSATSLIDTCPMDGPTSRQHHDQDSDAPRDASFDGPRSSSEHALDDHNRRWSMMSFEQQHHTPSVSPQAQNPHAPVFTHAGAQSQHRPTPPRIRQLLIRCTCGISSDRGQPLIQCQSCTQWVHAPCVGLDSQALPPSFTCFLCTKPPPSRARANLRNPVR